MVTPYPFLGPGPGTTIPRTGEAGVSPWGGILQTPSGIDPANRADWRSRRRFQRRVGGDAVAV